jgi:hypothetical protein
MPVDFELDVSFENHDELIHGMPVILPGLARGISPDVTAETPGLPISADGIHVDHGNTFVG